jgi:hypothetical protein
MPVRQCRALYAKDAPGPISRRRSWFMRGRVTYGWHITSDGQLEAGAEVAASDASWRLHIPETCGKALAIAVISSAAQFLAHASETPQKVQIPASDSSAPLCPPHIRSGSLLSGKTVMNTANCTDRRRCRNSGHAIVYVLASSIIHQGLDMTHRLSIDGCTSGQSDRTAHRF